MVKDYTKAIHTRIPNDVKPQTSLVIEAIPSKERKYYIFINRIVKKVLNTVKVNSI
jgi:hypothetical protein